MVLQRVPEKKYRLHDGRLGTEYEMCQELIAHWNAKRQWAEDKIEEFTRRAEVADGR